MKIDNTQSFKVTNKTKCKKFLATGDFNVWLSSSVGIKIYNVSFIPHPNYDVLVVVIYEDK